MISFSFVSSQSKLKKDTNAIMKMCGCFEVTFNFSETINLNNRENYKPSEDYQTSPVYELAIPIKQDKNHISIQHILQVGDDNYRSIVKHWRQDWMYQNKSLYIYEKHNSGVMSLTMNCAPVNALTSSNLMYLYNLLGDLEKDRSVHALVVNSSFKVFSAGINLKDAKDFTSDQQTLMVKGLNFAFSKLFQFPKPVIVAAEGAAIAGGFFFILTSDYRVGGAKSMYGLAEARVGVDFPKPLLEIAKSVLSAADLRRLMQSGNPINSEQALTSGIIDEIVDTGEAFNRALIVAEDYSNIPKKTYSRIKRQVRGVSIDKINELMKNNSGVPVDGWYGDETRAAMDAMLK